MQNVSEKKVILVTCFFLNCVYLLNINRVCVYKLPSDMTQVIIICGSKALISAVSQMYLPIMTQRRESFAFDEF